MKGTFFIFFSRARKSKWRTRGREHEPWLLLGNIGKWKIGLRFQALHPGSVLATPSTGWPGHGLDRPALCGAATRSSEKWVPPIFRACLLYVSFCFVLFSSSLCFSPLIVSFFLFNVVFFFFFFFFFGGGGVFQREQKGRDKPSLTLDGPKSRWACRDRVREQMAICLVPQDKDEPIGGS